MFYYFEAVVINPHWPIKKRLARHLKPSCYLYQLYEDLQRTLCIFYSKNIIYLLAFSVASFWLVTRAAFFARMTIQRVATPKTSKRDQTWFRPLFFHNYHALMHNLTKKLLSKIVVHIKSCWKICCSRAKKLYCVWKATAFFAISCVVWRPLKWGGIGLSWLSLIVDVRNFSHINTLWKGNLPLHYLLDLAISRSAPPPRLVAASGKLSSRNRKHWRKTENRVGMKRKWWERFWLLLYIMIFVSCGQSFWKLVAKYHQTE